jgi:hypothetical protein
VKHKDLNVDILMHDRLNNNRGVLTDYDLARQPGGDEWIGFSSLFKSSDLSPGENRGNSDPLYRHDCQSFAWMLLWIFSLFQGQPARTWMDSYSWTYLRHVLLRQSTTDITYTKFWPAVSAFVKWFCKPDDSTQKVLADGKTMDEMVGEVQILLADKGFPMEL